MSTNSKNTDTTATNIIYAITRQINKTLKLGDVGKFDSFLSRVSNTLSKEIKGLERIASNEQYNHDNRLEELNDKLKDAEQELEASYLNIELDSIGTNQKETDYVDTYLGNIDRHVLAVQKIEKSIATENEVYADFVKNSDAQIASLNKRITAISAK
jgi:hypothetical protein